MAKARDTVRRHAAHYKLTAREFISRYGCRRQAGSSLEHGGY